MAECCAKCCHSTEEELNFRGKKRRYLHCGNENAGHRRGWTVQVGMQNGNFPELAPPTWCPGFVGKVGA